LIGVAQPERIIGMKHRKDRVSELLVHAVSDILRLKIKDPRVAGVTITDVRMSSDLKSANVYFCSLADGKAEEHKKGLEAAAGFIRHSLREQLDLKYIPVLSFFYDSSFDNFSKINKILKEIETTEPKDE
jgi:ribosome-binding factor A